MSLTVNLTGSNISVHQEDNKRDVTQYNKTCSAVLDGSCNFDIPNKGD